ncbi:hypothetical protein JOF56_008733 [Kibdelosporangium banguiense]|uniref:Uncharacterized protein n=1 Tax=Kibdelosporangium banguiense TaxID=1365924 RepID=A0ABS4TVG4_9PSEU|nr:hypothetical protein [Kibdelosporangium banguiense]
MVTALIWRWPKGCGGGYPPTSPTYEVLMVGA